MSNKTNKHFKPYGNTVKPQNMTLRAILNSEKVNQVSAVAAEHGKVMIVFTSNTCRVGEVLGEYSSRSYVKKIWREVYGVEWTFLN